ncbi:MAG TPA: translation elongation factor 4, partial [Candidatus Polarisedimenticolaceae bacterium]|nr:translation elongation factor 4 [Candidatus Polarisedimenticolaceae bacterium]
QIRNFSIIAHIDHGKTTLSDRLLEKTGAVTDRERHDQMLDSMDLERERGITIKSHAVTLTYRAKDGRDYTLNLIDTPGHVDFSYEVSRSLAACEGALLVVDASQGVEAQTLANTYLAVEHDLEVIPVINKIDLPSADVERAREQIEQVVGIDTSATVAASAKEGLGIDEILEQVVALVPPPSGDAGAPPKALIFDSWYDPYRGVVMLVRVVDGSLEKRMAIRLMNTGGSYEIEELGIFAPKPTPLERLGVGEVGFVIANIKKISDCQIGDTITAEHNPTPRALPGFREVKPMVFAGLYPTDAAQFEDLRDAMDKLRLNDSAFSFEPESSGALGFGFRCGFLGLLHMEIVQERLEREFDLSLITTAPGVSFVVTTTRGERFEVHNPSKLPERQFIDRIEEPVIEALIILPAEYLGTVFRLCEERRGVQKKMSYLSKTRVLLEYELPLSEVVLDFYDKLKSGTRGYASLDYHFAGHRPSQMVKLDLLVNGEAVDALSLVCHRDKAEQKGRALAARMKELIPRQMFEVVIQAAVGGKILCRETIRPLGKNVLAKCYGGDITRKRKLLEKQKEGKRRMKRVGRVDIPQDAFLAILKVD